MIVRILGENQYRLDERHMQHIALLDNRLLEAAHADDHQNFALLLHRLVKLIHVYGQRLLDEELVASDLIVPSPDMTLHEAKKYLEKPVV